jgi:hypothetical protein
MLISMPTDTSTIFGAFQAIWFSFDRSGPTRPSRLRADQTIRQLNLLPGAHGSA